MRCVGWQKQRVGPCRRSNPGPLEPKSRIIPLDHRADTKIKSKQNNIPPNIKHNTTHTHTCTRHATPKDIHDTRRHTNKHQTHPLPLLVRSQHIHTSPHIYHPSSSPLPMPMPIPHACHVLSHNQTTRQSNNQTIRQSVRSSTNPLRPCIRRSFCAPLGVDHGINFFPRNAGPHIDD